MRKLRLTETQLTYLIEKTVNEELLMEKKVCGWWMRDGGSGCENRRRQQAWNCGVEGGWEAVSPNDQWGCGVRVPTGGNDGSVASGVSLSETELIGLIEKTVNEELLMEKKVCGIWRRNKGKKCENRRRQQAWNCGVEGGWEAVDPNSQWGCGGVFGSGGEYTSGGVETSDEINLDMLAERRHIRRILRKL